MRLIVAKSARTFAHLAENSILLMLAGLHILALLSLLAVLFTASQSYSAQEPVACTGKNILAELERTDPGAFAALEREADSVPNGKGAFWKIEKDGIASSFLLGTMHVTDPRVLAMPVGAEKAFADAATVVIESDEIIDDRKAGAAILSRPDLTMFAYGKTIGDFLSPEDKRKLEAGLKERGIPLTLVARMKPWMIASFVALPACEMSRKAAGASFLDKKLAENAIAQGKSLKGLETLVEQLSAMDALPVELHLRGLIDTLDLGDRIDDVVETTLQLYLAGEIGMIMPMMKAADSSQDGKSDAGYAGFEQRIITDRNRIMAERAQPLLAQGKVFMAVGALHLPGKDGVIELLRANGYRVTAVN